MVVAGRAAGRRRREVKERSRSGLCGHGWCVWEEAGGGRREVKGGVGDVLRAIRVHGCAWVCRWLNVF